MASVDTVKLQLAMAFGQGAGTMLADREALETLLSEQSDIIERALRDWDASQWAFISLVRMLGQHSAARAAANGSAVIRWEDVKFSLPTVMIICPCSEAHFKRPTGAGR